jgi:acetyl-CoA acyltransferase
MNPRDVVIVAGLRTPFVKAGGELAQVHPVDLGVAALKELLQSTGVPVDQIDEVIIGNTGSPSDAVNISRVVAMNAGIPQKVSAYTVHRNCASALESITSGYEKIKSGTMDIVVAGGTESMSQMPLIWNKEHMIRFNRLASAKSTSAKLSAISSLLMANFNQVKELVTTPPMKSTKFKPRMSLVEGLTDPMSNINMGDTAEILAKEFGISRAEQDQFALRSHQRAAASQENGVFKQEITPIYLAPKFNKVIEQDVGPRKTQSLEALAKLKPIFDRKYGTVTAGNACPITDGAAMVLLMSAEKAQELGFKPIAKIKGYAFAGLEPERMGLGPVYSTPIALKRAGLKLSDIDRIELNEAFAAQVMACQKASASKDFCVQKLGLSEAMGEMKDDILNVNGGAIALGHPVGATGTRLVITLMNELKRSQKQFGLATLCIGGGQGGALILENLS